MKIEYNKDKRNMVKAVGALVILMLWPALILFSLQMLKVDVAINLGTYTSVFVLQAFAINTVRSGIRLAIADINTNNEHEHQEDKDPQSNLHSESN